MKGFLRRLRGIIGMGLTWAVAGAGVLTGVGLFGGGFVPGLTLTGAFMGFFAGSAFGVILSVIERHKRLEDLSLKRMALWGGLGGFLIAAGINLFLGSGGLFWDFVATMTLVRAGFSSGTVAIARRATEPTLIGEDDEPPPALKGE